ncbi:hypothetical protein [Cognatishimia sp. MH4019]|uniref:hypothetical protein n=1 Tax=Cognatishimia sp. MH4019 TaxID=2854030 RepID=UPI001CD29F4F|nr:hypothetical protein [Cognatishimia sp. MH4019]
MSFIRPEAQKTIMRFREVLVGAGLDVLGLVLILTGRGLAVWIGVAICIGASILLVAGIQRARFRNGAGGAGVVNVVEGAVSYFGPLTGGAVSIREMNRLSFDPRQTPPHWVLEQTGHDPLFIPMDAEGAEALFDAFEGLKGLNTQYMLRVMNDPPAAPVTIWQHESSTVRRLT